MIFKAPTLTEAELLQKRINDLKQQIYDFDSDEFEANLILNLPLEELKDLPKLGEFLKREVKAYVASRVEEIQNLTIRLAEIS